MCSIVAYHACVLHQTGKKAKLTKKSVVIIQIVNCLAYWLELWLLFRSDSCCSHTFQFPQRVDIKDPPFLPAPQHVIFVLHLLTGKRDYLSWFSCPEPDQTKFSITFVFVASLSRASSTILVCAYSKLHRYLTIYRVRLFVKDHWNQGSLTHLILE
jgi:hypothetical protein